MTHRTPDYTTPRRPRPSRPVSNDGGVAEAADLVRESWEKLLRVRPL
jgi:hypothetical protein